MGREGRCRGWGRILDFIYALVYALGWGENRRGCWDTGEVKEEG